MTQEENLDTSHQTNNAVYDQVNDDTNSGSKNIVANLGERNSSLSSGATAIESNKSLISESSLEGEVPVPDRDRDHQTILNVGNANEHKINNSNFIDMTVIKQQNSNDSLRDIQSNIIENINKNNVTTNLKNISDRATADNISVHSEKAINTDPESDGASSGKFPKNENSCIQTTDKNYENDCVKLLDENNDAEQKSDLDNQQQQEQLTNVDPIARLNALRANISNALKEVKAVLDQHAPPPDQTTVKDAKREDDSCVKFRFVRRIRRKSVINTEDEEIICNAPSNIHKDDTKPLPEGRIDSNKGSTEHQQTEKPAVPEKNNHASQAESLEKTKTSESKQKLNEDHVGKLKDGGNKPKDLQSVISADIQKKDVKQKDKPTDEIVEKPNNDSTKPKDPKIRRKVSLQKAVSIDNDGNTKMKEVTRMKRGSLTETKTPLAVAKLKRASICEGDLAKLPKQITEKKLTKIQPKSAESVKLKASVQKTASKDNITTDTKLEKTIPSQPEIKSVTNTARNDVQIKALQITSTPALLEASLSQSENLNTSNVEESILKPIAYSNAKIEAPNEIPPLISSIERKLSSESLKSSTEKPILAVTNVLRNEVTRTIPTKPSLILDTRRQSKLETNISVISSPTSLLGSQLIPKADKIESPIAQSKSTENLAIVKSTALNEMPVSVSPSPSLTMEIAEEIVLQEFGSSQKKESQHNGLATMKAQDQLHNQQRPNTDLKETIVSQVKSLDGPKEKIQVSSNDLTPKISLKSTSPSHTPKLQTKNTIDRNVESVLPPKEEEKTKSDQEIGSTSTSSEVVNSSSNPTSKHPQISTTTIPSPTSETSNNLPTTEAPKFEAPISESIESNKDSVAESLAGQSETAAIEERKPATKKRKIKKKVIIKRIKRRLSRDNSQDEKLEPEVCEKPIEPDIEEVEQIAPVEEIPSGPKSCLKVRAYEPGDVVMYADRVRKSVKWKKATVVSKITSISYSLNIEGEEKPAHISYIKKFTDKKVQFGGKEYLEIDYEQENEEPEEEVYNIWARV